MKKLIIHFIAFMISLSCLRAQLATSEINLSKFNASLLEELYIKKLNDLRVEKKCTNLKRDAVLSLAAQDQASYMANQNKLTLSQTSKGKETTIKRVFFYKGTHEGINENSATIPIKKLSSSKAVKNAKLITTYEQAATALLENFKLNKNQFKNLINNSADVYGIGFSLTQDSALYVSQIFAYKPYKPIKSKGIVDSDFGILPNNTSVCNCFKSYESSDAVGSVLIQNFDGLVYIKSENLNGLKNLFSGPKDGIYLDVILREQFTCDNNILMHGSPVYDGTMLKPVMFSEIFKKNEAKDNINLYAPLCKVPDYFKNKVYALNIGFIKNGYSCEYSVTYTPPGQNFSILNLRPKWLYKKSKLFKEDSISGKIDLFIPFKRNETIIDNTYKNDILRKLKNYSSSIKEIKIKTYSSVEGSEQANVTLHEKRAQEIKKLLSTTIDKNIPITFEIKENWDDFYDGIKNTPFAYLEKLSKKEIKKHLQRKSLIDSVSFLMKKTRTSSLELKLKAHYDYNTEPDLLLASYQLALANDDSLKTATIQNRLLDYTFENKIQESEMISVSLPSVV